MKPEARRIAVARHLAVAPRNTLPQMDLVALTCQPRKDIVYTVRTMRADRLVSTITIDGRVHVTLTRCIREARVHVTPHRGCLLR